MRAPDRRARARAAWSTRPASSPAERSRRALRRALVHGAAVAARGLRAGRRRGRARGTPERRRAPSPTTPRPSSSRTASTAFVAASASPERPGRGDRPASRAPFVQNPRRSLGPVLTHGGSHWRPHETVPSCRLCTSERCHDRLGPVRQIPTDLEPRDCGRSVLHVLPHPGGGGETYIDALQGSLATGSRPNISRLTQRCVAPPRCSRDR